MSPAVIKALFQFKMRKLVHKAANLEDEAVKRSLKLLEQTRRDVISTIADSDWQIYRLNELKVATERAMLDFAEKYKSETLNTQILFNELGIKFEDVPLKSIGIDVGSLLVRKAIITTIDPVVVGIMQDFTPDLITGMTQEGIKKINTSLTGGLLGRKTPFQVMQEIAGKLNDKSVFSSIQKRAEIITRTEGSRVLQAASHAREMEAVKVLPGLQKEWKHAYFGKNPRTGHQKADGQIRDVNAYFDVAPHDPVQWKYPMEKLMYPKDPRGSAYNTIGCDCYKMPYHQRWKELKDYAKAA